MTSDVICGDAIKVLARQLDAEIGHPVIGPYRQVVAPHSVSSIVTDPPYGLKLMSMEWDGDVAFHSEIWDLCRLAARPGAHLFAFGSTRRFHRLVSAIEAAGWEIRDTVCWHYGTGVPKNKGSLKPATELICVARAPLQGTIKENEENWGTGRLWPERCRVPLINGEKLPSFETHPARNLMPGGNDGLPWSSRRTASDYRGPCRSGASADGRGRWPGNMAHDGSQEEMFPDALGQLAAVPAGRDRGDAVTFRSSSRTFQPRGYKGTAARFFYCAKPTTHEREMGLVPSKDGTRRNRHPTVKPLALMRWLIRLGCPVGGLVLDPFCGTGTTGIAAAAEGMHFIGIESDPDYAAMARERL